jgi:protein-tyrosine phosphatase
VPPYRIAVVCTGNICRSPIGHVVLEAALAEAGIDAEVTSFGTGSWHVGDPMDPRAARVLTSAGYDATRHRAAHFTTSQVGRHDLVLAMDGGHYADLADLGVGPELRMFRDFDPDGPGDVADPYYGRLADFERVLEICERVADELAGRLARRPVKDPSQ